MHMTLEETIEHHRAHLIRRMIKNFNWEKEDAEDMLQDAWIKLARQAPPEDGNWSPYLLQTVKTLSMDRMKVEGNRLRLHEDKWGKIAQGFNLLEKPAEKLVSRTPKEEEYLASFDK